MVPALPHHAPLPSHALSLCWRKQLLHAMWLGLKWCPSREQQAFVSSALSFTTSSRCFDCIGLLADCWQLAAAPDTVQGLHLSLQPFTFQLFENAFATHRVAFGLGGRAAREGSAVSGQSTRNQPLALQ